MKSIQFESSAADPCIYVRGTNQVRIVAVYVDDLIVATTTPEEMLEVKEMLKACYKMKDMGELHYCLGISIDQNKEERSIRIHQKQYIVNMLEKYGLTEAKIVATPADLNVRLQADDGVSKLVDQVTYQSMVGSVLYAAIATRPDISQAVGVVSKYSSEPTEGHLTAVKRILRYVKGTADLAITYKRSEDTPLFGYSDADWAGDLDDRHSTTGNMFQMAGGPISWLSKKQAMVTLSTAEAEYVALSTAAQEAVWLRQLLKDFKVPLEQPTLIKEDNQGAMAIARNPVSHGRTKHIDIRYHFIREAIQERKIFLEYCPIEDMLADLLTKPIPKARFKKLRDEMGMGYSTLLYRVEPSRTEPVAIKFRFCTIV